MQNSSNEGSQNKSALDYAAILLYPKYNGNSFPGSLVRKSGVEGRGGGVDKIAGIIWSMLLWARSAKLILGWKRGWNFNWWLRNRRKFELRFPHLIQKLSQTSALHTPAFLIVPDLTGRPSYAVAWNRLDLYTNLKMSVSVEWMPTWNLI